MRILFYSDNLHPELSGISDSIIALGRELTRRDHVVAFVGPRYTPDNYREVGLEPGAASPLDDFAVRRLPAFNYAGASGVARFVLPLGISLPFVRRFRPDVIHSQTPFGVGIEALLAARTAALPLVGTNHTIIDPYVRIYGPIRNDTAVRVANRLFSFYYNRCDFVTVPWSDLLEQMRHFGLRVTAEVLSNPVPCDRFSPVSETERAAIRAELGLRGPTVLFSGRVAAEKRIDVILRAFPRVLAQMPEARLVIAGGGPVEKSLHALAQSEGIASAVTFTGCLPHAELARWYRAVDVFATMGGHETQCLSLMQAFASGLPCVGVKAGAVGQHLAAAGATAVEDGDNAGLAAAVERILRDPEGGREMGLRARKYVERFSAPAIAEHWLQIYARVLAARGGRRPSGVDPTVTKRSGKSRRRPVPTR